MRQYNSDNVNIAWLGLDWAEGLADGVFITDTRALQSFTVKPTARGKLVRTFNPQKHGTISLLVDQSSALHQQLLAVAAADRDPNQRNQVDTMVVREPNVAVTNYQNTFILVEPDESRAMESTSFTWLFAYEKKQPEPQTTPQNLVGN
jgi:hypothetical protein